MDRLTKEINKSIKGLLAKLGKYLSEGNLYQKEVYYGMLFNQVTLNSKWLKDKSFAAGRWAVDYCYLYTMYRSLEVIRPHSILDLGLGQTSRMLAQYSSWMRNEMNEDVFFVSVEHDPKWIDFFKIQYDLDFTIQRLDLLRNASYRINNSLIANEANIYKDFDKWLETTPPLDFVSIDAPYRSKPFSRPQIFDLIKKNKLKDDFVIMMDDLNRKGEQNTIQVFMEEIKKYREGQYFMKIYNGSKKHCLITTENYKFLTTL